MIIGQSGLITIGGYTFSRSGMIALIGRFSSSTSNITTLRKSNAAVPATPAGYQITAGKTFNCLAWRLYVNQTSSGGANLGYGDTDVGPFSSSFPTNPIFEGVSNAQDNDYFSFPGPVVGVSEGVTDFQIPATKYPFVRGDGTLIGTILVYGYEA